MQNSAQLTQAVKLLRALNNKFKQRILEFLGDDKKNVTQIIENLNEEQSVISQHLGGLRQHEIVSTERRGKFIFYWVNKDRLGHIMLLCKKLIAGEEDKPKG